MGKKRAETDFSDLDLVQLNIKATPEDKAQFLSIRDERGITGGRLFAEMLAALKMAHEVPRRDDVPRTVNINIHL